MVNKTTDTAGKQLLQTAIEKLAQTTGLKINVIAYDHPIGQGRHLDALADIETTTAPRTYAIEIKRHLTNAKLGLAAEQLKGTPYKGMIVTDYVNPQIAERLKDMNLAFIDLAGNAYLNEPPVFIYIKGNRLAETHEQGQTMKPRRAFQATGLKVIFGFLTVPGLLQQTYREIAKATDVALGTVGWVLNDLREHGFLYDGKRGKRQLVQTRRIVEQWVTAYPDKLRPKLRLGRYRTQTHDWWQGVNLAQHNAQWGGEVAAALLTNYLIPEQTIIYADAPPGRLMAENRMLVDKEGDIEVLKRFWRPHLLDRGPTQPAVPTDVVPPLLVYADLMATADDRNVETAKLIYEEFLGGHFQ